MSYQTIKRNSLRCIPSLKNYREAQDLTAFIQPTFCTKLLSHSWLWPIQSDSGESTKIRFIMKAKVKSGQHLLSHHIDHIEVSLPEMFLNLESKSCYYVSIRQSKGEVKILTTLGIVELKFCTDAPMLSFNHQCKGQLVFDVKLSQWQQSLLAAV